MTHTFRYDSDTANNLCGNKNVLQKKKNMISNKILFVVDLDETLIDDKYEIFVGAIEFLRHLKKLGYVLLWTGGDQQHVKLFLKKYSNASRYIDQYFCGLIDNIKPVNEAKRIVFEKTHKYYPIVVLIDDNLQNLKLGRYDFVYNALLYRTGTRLDQINYTQMLEEIEKINLL